MCLFFFLFSWPLPLCGLFMIFIVGGLWLTKKLIYLPKSNWMQEINTKRKFIFANGSAEDQMLCLYIFSPLHFNSTSVFCVPSAMSHHRYHTYTHANAYTHTHTHNLQYFPKWNAFRSDIQYLTSPHFPPLCLSPCLFVCLFLISQLMPRSLLSLCLALKWFLHGCTWNCL